MKKNVVVVGGGASGLMAAIMAARNDANVIVIEHKDRVGKKILMTGNGKCNLTNMSDLLGKYHSDEVDKVYEILKTYTAMDVRKAFETMGLYTKEKKDGGVYPVSEQASSVLDILRLECCRLNIHIMTDIMIKQIDFRNKKVELENKKIDYDSLILATGSKAAPVSGSDGSGYSYAKQLGHKVIEPLPALVQLRCQGNYFKSIAGVRTQAKLALKINHKFVENQEGELQLTDYGISGIPVFQLSGHVAKALKQKKDVEVIVDFLPYLTKEDKKNIIENYMDYKDRSLEELLTGFIHKKLAAMIVKEMSFKSQTKVGDLKQQEISKIVNLLCNFAIKVRETNSFEQAQVCSGGVSLNEITQEMESKKMKNVFLCGELLDCDGICGGYNLHWAWVTGMIAGKSAAN